MPVARGIDDTKEGGLGLSIAIEQQWIVRSAWHRLFVEPGRPVVQVPEGDTIDLGLVAEKEREQFTVALRLKLETALHAAHADADAASGYCDSEPLRLAPAPTLAAHAGGSP